MREPVQRIAKIESTRLGLEDHGIFTAYIALDYGDGGHQSAGGFSLDDFDPEKKHRVGTAFGMEWIRRAMKACGVESWEQLEGRTVYALLDPRKPTGFGSKIIGLAPLPTEPGEPFLFADLADEFFPEDAAA